MAQGGTKSVGSAPTAHVEDRRPLNHEEEWTGLEGTRSGRDESGWEEETRTSQASIIYYQADSHVLPMEGPITPPGLQVTRYS